MTRFDLRHCPEALVTKLSELLSLDVSRPPQDLAVAAAILFGELKLSGSTRGTQVTDFSLSD